MIHEAVLKEQSVKTLRVLLVRCLEEMMGALRKQHKGRKLTMDEEIFLFNRLRRYQDISTELDRRWKRPKYAST